MKINLKNWQTLKNMDELFNEIKSLIKTSFPYKDLEFFDRDEDEFFNIKIERELISDKITEIEINTIIKEFVIQLTDKYINAIKLKATAKNISEEEFEKKISPQEATKSNNLLFCCFNIPIAFQRLDVNYKNKTIIIDCDIAIIDDLLEDNAILLK
jgi:uncharacterized Zn finger protein